jgi:hypothetical protein
MAELKSVKSFKVFKKLWDSDRVGSGVLCEKEKSRKPNSWVPARKIYLVCHTMEQAYNFFNGKKLAHQG